jgi:succinate dehydrogenase / fumarate reductase flavoprotein subunit
MPDAADNTGAALELISGSSNRDLNTAEMVQKLQVTMQDDVGALRSETGLRRALGQIESLTQELGEIPLGDGKGFDMRRIDWLDLRNMLLVARVVTDAALTRTETRGAQQREDFPQLSPDWELNQFVGLRDGRLVLSKAATQTRAAAS